MTPELKAKELVEKFRNEYKWVELDYPVDLYRDAKQCALIAVDEIIYIVDRVSDISGNYLRLTSSGNYGDSDKELEFWESVKESINKL